MERVLAVVFNDESKAYEAQSALRQLELQGDISIYADAVVVKLADGTVSVKQQHDFGPRGTLLGTSLGSIIGLLGGPAGVAMGAVTGLTIGGLVDAGSLTVGADLVDEVSRSISPNKVAVIAQIDETGTRPVDTHMEALGGVIFRRSAWQGRDDIELQIAPIKADLAQLEQEALQASADRKAKTV